MKGTKRLLSNTVSSLVYEVCAIVCGFILPRAILSSYGSDVNGLVSSVNQFLGFISLLEMGIGAVIQSSLYKPLVERDWYSISSIASSGQKFFSRIAYILMVYVLVLMIAYPCMVAEEFGFLYTATLIAVMSISSFAQYYLGMVNGLILTADQHGYISYITQSLTLLCNTFACMLLIQAGASIHIVKLTTSLIFLCRPLYLAWYVKKHYRIDRRVDYLGEPIKQKWNGIAQHIGAVVLGNTDTVVLTACSSLTDVSIYAIYNLVVSGVNKLVMSLTGGMQALMGEFWARNDKEGLNYLFNWFEWLLHTVATYVFSVTAVLIVPFISVYTSEITDTNYIQPAFAMLLVFANAMHCLRLPYNLLILASGSYRQTQMNYIIAATINIILSFMLVYPLGLAGVAIGTIVAMGYQTFWMAWYVSRNLICRSPSVFFRQFAADATIAVAILISTSFFSLVSISWLSWFTLAIKTSVVALLATLVVNSIFYRDYVRNCFMIGFNLMHGLFCRGGVRLDYVPVSTCEVAYAA